MKIVQNTSEQNILAAARKVFVLKGFDGARMQEIADEAGINKALLHYYFRSKEKLFEAIFQVAFRKIFANVNELLESDKPIVEKISLFIDGYMDVLLQNPDLPGFIAHEINRNPDRVISLLFEGKFNPGKLILQFSQEISKGSIRPIAPQHLMVNIIAMCIFPFIARPMLGKIVFQGDPKLFEQFMLERKQEIKQFVIHSITK
jgi:TetR/AcrR family transcriptional regulator